MSAAATRKLVLGNWKMNLGERAARELIVALTGTLPFDRLDAGVAPAFPCLRAALDAAAGSPLMVGAQNVHWEERGAFTGEVAPSMLSEMGVQFVLIGHSERRSLFAETDALVAKKLAAVRRHGLTPILCVGETESQRDLGTTGDVVVAQVAAVLDAADAGTADGLVIAYEPVWAIGTGRTPSITDVTEAHAAIRGVLLARLGDRARAIRILYGGSVTAANAGELLHAADVGGALVGGASLDPSSFRSIAAAAAF